MHTTHILHAQEGGGRIKRATDEKNAHDALVNQQWYEMRDEALANGKNCVRFMEFRGEFWIVATANIWKTLSSCKYSFRFITFRWATFAAHQSFCCSCKLICSIRVLLKWGSNSDARTQKWGRWKKIVKNGEERNQLNRHSQMLLVYLEGTSIPYRKMCFLVRVHQNTHSICSGRSKWRNWTKRRIWAKHKRLLGLQPNETNWKR